MLKQNIAMFRTRTNTLNEFEHVFASVCSVPTINFTLLLATMRIKKLFLFSSLLDARRRVHRPKFLSIVVVQPLLMLITHRLRVYDTAARAVRHILRNKRWTVRQLGLHYVYSPFVQIVCFCLRRKKTFCGSVSVNWNERSTHFHSSNILIWEWKMKLKRKAVYYNLCPFIVCVVLWAAVSLKI